MADDPVEAARRRQQAMLRRGSYFPAANLRQFEGTELSPPGAGTYYNPDRYRGAPYQARIQRELAKAWQSDLAFNVMANPNMARSLEAERIGAQYGGGKSFAGKPGYQTIQLAGGGTAVVSDSVAKRLQGKPGFNVAGTRPSPAEAYQTGFTGQPQFAGIPASQQTPYQRSYIAGYQGGQGGRESAGVTMPPTTFGEYAGQKLGRLGTLGYNAIASLFRSSQPKVASEQGGLLNDINDSFYGGGHAYPSPTPTASPSPSANFLAYNQPRRYFDE